MTKRKLTQADVRAQGKCGHGFNYGGPGGAPLYCGKPSEPGASFGDCRKHAGEFRKKVREIYGNDRRLESVEGIERGHRALGAERFENLPGHGRAEVKRRAAQAQRTRGRRSQ